MRRMAALFAALVLVPVTAVAAAPPIPMPPAVQGPLVVPAGTKVPLRFLTRIDSAAAKAGDAVKFEIAADVLIDRFVAFHAGAPAQGVITDVSAPGIFGKNARVHITYIQTAAADGRPVELSPIDVSPESVHQVKDAGAAAGASVAGAILLGPIGLAAGALIHGGNVVVPVGSLGMTEVAQRIEVEGL